MGISSKRARFAAIGAVLCGAACTPTPDEGLDTHQAFEGYNPVCSSQEGYDLNRIASGPSNVKPGDYGWTEKRLQAAFLDADTYHRNAAIYFFPIGEKPDLAIIADYDESYTNGLRGRDRVLFPVGAQSPMDSFSYVVSGAFSPDDVMPAAIPVRGPLNDSCPPVTQPMTEDAYVPSWAPTLSFSRNSAAWQQAIDGGWNPEKLRSVAEGGIESGFGAAEVCIDRELPEGSNAVLAQGLAGIRKQRPYAAIRTAQPNRNFQDQRDQTYATARRLRNCQPLYTINPR